MKLKQIVTTKDRIGEQWAGIPGIELTPNGRLFATWFSGGPTEPDPANNVYLSMSDDKGQTFSDGVIMAEPENGARAYDSCLWLAPDGVLWLFFNRSNRKDYQGVHARICENPDAPIPVWGEEYRIGFDVPFSFRLNKPTVLSTGEWIMPVTYMLDVTERWLVGDRYQGVAVSTDQGRSWKFQEGITAPELLSETIIIERKDGTLEMFIRTLNDVGVLWRSFSYDKGRTWSAASPTTIANPGTRFHIRRLPDGDWLLINSPDPTRRTRIEAFISSDEGQTWSRPLVLDERDDVSYPDSTMAPDGTIYAVHDRKRKEVGEVLLSVFTKEDILEDVKREA